MNKELWDWISRTNAIASWCERIWRLCSAVMASTWFAGLIWFVVTAGLAWVRVVWNFIPWWYVLFSTIFMAILATHLFIFLKRANAIRGQATIDIRQIGLQCGSLRQDMLDFLVERADSGPVRRSSNSSEEVSKEALYADWAQGVEHHSRTRARLTQKFGHRIVAVSHLLETIGVTSPNLRTFDLDAVHIATFVGAVGELLQQGLLDEARRLNAQPSKRILTDIM